MRCSHCNSKLKKNTKYCPECGMTVIWEDDSQTDHKKEGKRRLAAILISLLVVGAVAFLALGGVEWIKGTIREVAFSDNPTAISTASQSVVKLNCYGRNGDLYATGSGFACFADNLIVTNYHVIEGGVYSIEASTETGNIFDITYILAADKEKDIAILGTSTPHNLALLQPGNSDDLQKGEKVVAIGSPLGLLNSVSTGVFSGYVDENGMAVLQFTASISSGSSGGALFNDAGEVLGVTFASYEGQNLNLAVPINEVKYLYDNKGESIAIDDWYENNKTGYDYLMDSQFVEYDELVSDPEAYNGKLISIVGYASYTQDQVITANGVYNRIYLLPNKSFKTWENKPSVLVLGTIKMESYSFYWVETPFEESLMIRCDDITHSISVHKYAEDYLIVAGLFSYTDGVASIDLRYAGQE